MGQCREVEKKHDAKCERALEMSERKESVLKQCRGTMSDLKHQKIICKSIKRRKYVQKKEIREVIT